MSNVEAELASRLGRMRWLATGLLALSAAVFIVTSFFREALPFLNPIWAFAEAALIGGLADWFAVTALFRHPLGLRIPHTAIIPNRKDQIGRALARFIAEHFLVRSALSDELERLNMAKAFGVWLARESNARSLGNDTAKALAWVLTDAGSDPLRAAVASGLADAGQSLPTERLLGALISVLAEGPHSDELVDGLVSFGREQLERNKGLIRERIRERSPWWLPKFVDEEIFDQLVAELNRILNEVGENADHPARAALKERLGRLQVLIDSDPAFMAKTNEVRREFLQHPAVAGFARDLSLHVRSSLVESLNDSESKLRRGIEAELSGLGETLVTDADLAATLNSWLAEIIIYVFETYSEPISSIVSATIAKWDARETSRRIELHIGRDLQFIRINGTLVGGLVGLVLYLSWAGLAG